MANLGRDKFNEMELIPLVGQMLLKGKFSELVDIAVAAKRVL